MRLYLRGRAKGAQCFTSPEQCSPFLCSPPPPRPPRAGVVGWSSEAGKISPGRLNSKLGFHRPGSRLKITLAKVELYSTGL